MLLFAVATGCGAPSDPLPLRPLGPLPYSPVHGPRHSAASHRRDIDDPGDLSTGLGGWDSGPALLGCRRGGGLLRAWSDWRNLALDRCDFDVVGRVRRMALVVSADSSWASLHLPTGGR